MFTCRWLKCPFLVWCIPVFASLWPSANDWYRQSSAGNPPVLGVHLHLCYISEAIYISATSLLSSESLSSGHRSSKQISSKMVTSTLYTLMALFTSTGWVQMSHDAIYDSCLPSMWRNSRTKMMSTCVNHNLLSLRFVHASHAAVQIPELTC